MDQVQLSVCIAVEHASQDLTPCITSCIEIADEFVVLDRCGKARVPDTAGIECRIVQVPRGGTHPAQISAQSATGDWLLLLDADEELSTALAQKVRHFKELGRLSEFRGFRVRRRRWVYQHPMVSMGLGADYPERLISRAVSDPDRRPRPLGRLDEPIEHFVVRSIDLWLRRRESAVERASERAVGWRMAFAAPLMFGWEFFVRGGFRDGKAGLTWAGLRATEYFLVAMRSWQRRLPRASN